MAGRAEWRKRSKNREQVVDFDHPRVEPIPSVVHAQSDDLS